MACTTRVAGTTTSDIAADLVCDTNNQLVWEFPCDDLMRLADVLWHKAREEQVSIPMLMPSKQAALQLPHKHLISESIMHITIEHEAAADVLI